MCHDVKKLADIEIREAIARISHELLELDRTIATTDEMGKAMELKSKRKELERLIDELHARLSAQVA